LRDETEWVETVKVGWNVLVGANEESMVEVVRGFTPPVNQPVLYGDGRVASQIGQILAAVI